MYTKTPKAFEVKLIGFSVLVLMTVQASLSNSNYPNPIPVKEEEMEVEKVSSTTTASVLSLKHPEICKILLGKYDKDPNSSDLKESNKNEVTSISFLNYARALFPLQILNYIKFQENLILMNLKKIKPIEVFRKGKKAIFKYHNTLCSSLDIKNGVIHLKEKSDQRNMQILFSFEIPPNYRVSHIIKDKVFIVEYFNSQLPNQSRLLAEVKCPNQITNTGVLESIQHNEISSTGIPYN